MKKISAAIIDTYTDKKFASIAIKMVKKISVVEDIHVFSDTPFDNVSGINFIKIPKLTSNNEYGRIIFEDLYRYIKDDHVLIFQWDGFPLNPDKWSNSFLEYDYIGAPNGDWVGNGGFSIRSRRLLETLKRLKISVDMSNPYDQPEDQIICTHKKIVLEENGIRFAPTSIARDFSFESGKLNKNVFGFHAPFNFPFFFSELDLIENCDSIVSRISQPTSMIPYLNNCASAGMWRLLKVTLAQFETKPNLLKAYQFLSASDPNSPLLNLFNRDFFVANHAMLQKLTSSISQTNPLN